MRFRKQSTHGENSRGIRRLFLKRQYLGRDVGSELFWQVVPLNSRERRETRRCITAINLGYVISAHRRSLLERVAKGNERTPTLRLPKLQRRRGLFVTITGSVAVWFRSDLSCHENECCDRTPKQTGSLQVFRKTRTGQLLSTHHCFVDKKL